MLTSKSKCPKCGSDDGIFVINIANCKFAGLCRRCYLIHKQRGWVLEFESPRTVYGNGGQERRKMMKT